MGNPAGGVDQTDHPEAACSKGRDKDRDMGHANGEGEEGGNMEINAPTDASCRSPCGALTSGKGYGSHLVLDISLDCAPSHDPLLHDPDGGSFHDPSLGLCQI